MKALALVPVLLLLACSTPAPVPAPTLAQQADSIARVFETPVEYTPLLLDTAVILRFLADHPESREDSASIRDFYKRRDHHFAWYSGDTLGHSAFNFLNLIASADSTAGEQHAQVGRWYRDLTALILPQDSLPATDSLRSATELALTATFFRVADAKYSGFVRKDLRELAWYIPRHKKNYERLLDSLVAGVNDLGPIEPLHPQYDRLKQQLKRYARLDSLPWPPLEAGDSLPHHLRRRLHLLGDLTSDDGSNEVDSALEAGVRAAQERFGLKETGKLSDKELLADLNVTPAERQRQILVNMERLRWVPAEQDSDLILVNIPEYRMHVYEHDTLAWDMDVVVGAEATRTVIFSGDLSQVVMAPYWNIPQSIISGEILPAVKKNAHYLDRKNMEVVIAGKVVPPSSIDWKKYSRGVPFTIRQKPGPGNALGRVKFLFPNDHSIYFHDTPAKDKFKRDQRAFSHGCIRLSEPARLAEYLLCTDTTWTPKKVKAAMDGKTEVTVRLKKSRPVVLGYFTAWVDRHGHMNFRRDVYGHDARLAAELFAPSAGVDVAAK